MGVCATYISKWFLKEYYIKCTLITYAETNYTFPSTEFLHGLERYLLLTVLSTKLKLIIIGTVYVGNVLVCRIINTSNHLIQILPAWPN